MSKGPRGACHIDIDVRYTPNNGHFWSSRKESANDPKRAFVGFQIFKHDAGRDLVSKLQLQGPDNDVVNRKRRHVARRTVLGHDQPC